MNEQLGFNNSDNVIGNSFSKYGPPNVSNEKLKKSSLTGQVDNKYQVLMKQTQEVSLGISVTLTKLLEISLGTSSFTRNYANHITVLKGNT